MSLLYGERRVLHPLAYSLAGNSGVSKRMSRDRIAQTHVR